MLEAGELLSSYVTHGALIRVTVRRGPPGSGITFSQPLPKIWKG